MREITRLSKATSFSATLLNSASCRGCPEERARGNGIQRGVARDNGATKISRVSCAHGRLSSKESSTTRMQLGEFRRGVKADLTIKPPRAIAGGDELRAELCRQAVAMIPKDGALRRDEVKIYGRAKIRGGKTISEGSRTRFSSIYLRGEAMHKAGVTTGKRLCQGKRVPTNVGNKDWSHCIFLVFERGGERLVFATKRGRLCFIGRDSSILAILLHASPSFIFRKTTSTAQPITSGGTWISTQTLPTLFIVWRWPKKGNTASPRRPRHIIAPSSLRRSTTAIGSVTRV